MAICTAGFLQVLRAGRAGGVPHWRGARSAKLLDRDARTFTLSEAADTEGEAAASVENERARTVIKCEADAPTADHEVRRRAHNAAFARDAALEVGLDLGFGPAIAAFTYGGQYGGGVSDERLRLDVRVRF
jgi:hypothetical protein